jgi:hypothetical protein
MDQANWILDETATSYEDEKRLRDFLAERGPSGNAKVEKIYTCPEVASTMPFSRWKICFPLCSTISVPMDRTFLRLVCHDMPCKVLH